MRMIENRLKYGKSNSKNRVENFDLIIILEPAIGGYTNMDECAFMLEKTYGSWPHSISGKDYAELYASFKEAILVDDDLEMNAAIEEFVLNIREILTEPINIEVDLLNNGEYISKMVIH